MMDWLRSFMTGRNGVDRLGVAIIITSVIANMLSKALQLGILGVFAAAGMLFALFRLLSRNLARRREENYRFIKMWDGVRAEYSGWRQRRAQSGTHRFFICPGCKNRLRVLKGKGRIQITCPRCGQRFSGKS